MKGRPALSTPTDYLEVWEPKGSRLIPLEGDRITVGKAPANDVALVDPSVSRLHGVLERIGSAWCIRDLNSRNGTYVNGERILGDRPLRQGDELRLGHTRLIYRSRGYVAASATVGVEAAPVLTRREHEVLVALCRPMLEEDVFTTPASTRQVAADLYISEDAVKQHLARLYDKFNVVQSGENRRARLANEAIRRGAVTLADLRGR